MLLEDDIARREDTSEGGYSNGFSPSSDVTRPAGRSATRPVRCFRLLLSTTLSLFLRSTSSLPLDLIRIPGHSFPRFVRNKGKRPEWRIGAVKRRIKGRRGREVSGESERETLTPNPRFPRGIPCQWTLAFRDQLVSFLFFVANPQSVGPLPRSVSPERVLSVPRRSDGVVSAREDFAGVPQG